MKWGHWVQAKEIHMQLNDRRTSPVWVEVSQLHRTFLIFIMYVFDLIIHILNIMSSRRRPCLEVWTLACSALFLSSRPGSWVNRFWRQAQTIFFSSSSWGTPRCSRAGWATLSPIMLLLPQNRQIPELAEDVVRTSQVFMFFLMHYIYNQQTISNNEIKW